MNMKIVHVSDNHNKLFDIPSCDLLIHSGDLTNYGDKFEIQRGLEWLSSQAATYKILVPGNHDFGFDYKSDMGPNKEELEKRIIEASQVYGVDVLIQDINYIEGLKIGTCSYVPMYGDWAFNLSEKERSHIYQSLLNEEPDILVTHSPPRGCLDKTWMGESMGDIILAMEIKSRYNQNLKLPKYLFCGHCHESRGQEDFYGIRVINSACTLTEVII